jgi:hypothetical protein
MLKKYKYIGLVLVLLLALPTAIVANADGTFSNLAVDFGTDTSPIASGFVRLGGDSYNPYSAARGYGWTDGTDTPVAMAYVDRGEWTASGNSDLYRDFHWAGASTRIFKIHVTSSGTYSWIFYYGDKDYGGGLFDLYVEDTLVGDDLSYSAGQAKSISGSSSVTDGYINFKCVLAGNTAFCGVEISPAMAYTTILHSTTVYTTAYTTVTTTSCDSYESTVYSTTSVTSVLTTAQTSVTTTIGGTLVSVDETVSVSESYSNSIDKTVIVASTQTVSTTRSTTVSTTMGSAATTSTFTFSQLLAYPTTVTSTNSATTGTATQTLTTTTTIVTTPHSEVVSVVYSVGEIVSVAGEEIWIGLKGSTGGEGMASVLLAIIVLIPAAFMFAMVFRRRRK